MIQNGNDLRDKYLRHDKKFPHMWCPGCGNGIVMGALLRAIDKSGLEKDDVESFISAKINQSHQELVAAFPSDYESVIEEYKSKCVNQDINNPPHMVIEREIRKHIEQDH